MLMVKNMNAYINFANRANIILFRVFNMVDHNMHWKKLSKTREFAIYVWTDNINIFLFTRNF